jgi:hypothetical protein
MPGHVAAHRAGEAVDVAQAKPGQAERRGGLHQLGRAGGAIQQAEVRARGELGEARHGGVP